ncbi:hypothetical protein AVEN_202728-1 [Araneus ventricosus]|uniref:Uncharacterized protein n=1 Tax=Araneus ventricosus TaxID=182803 RepID=A0A4Y2U392_ARAVE|nr:hypothetical protein AVEN_202728-1 [Araneus ventricosus]
MDESATVLFNVKYFIHGRFDKDDQLVHVVSTDENSGLILRKFFINQEGFTVFSNGNNTTGDYSIFPLEWEGEMEKRHTLVRSLDELKSLLDLNANFGVWGCKQLEIFSKLLPCVVDVSSHFMKVLMLEEPLAVSIVNESPLTIGKVFRNVTSPFKKNVTTLSQEFIDEETKKFKDWVERIAWPVFLNWCEISKEKQYDDCGDCLCYDSDLGDFSTDDEY